MRLMFIGDLHFRCQNPELRIDDYKQDIMNCTLESFQIAEKMNCDKVILLGDIFDSAEPVGIIRNEVIDMFQGKSDGTDWPFEIYAVIGNHDIIGHNLTTLKRTALGTLSRCGVKIVDEIREDGVGIFFGHFQDGIEQKDFSANDHDIYAMHSNILPETFVGDEYVLIKDFKAHEKTRLVISGHYHPGYPTKVREDGVVFANPGAIARKAAIKSNIERELQVAVVDITPETCKMKMVKLKTAKPGSEIFNIEEAMEHSQKRKDKKDLVNKLDEIRKNNPIELSESPLTDFKKYAKKNNISDEAISIVVSLIGEAELKNKENK